MPANEYIGARALWFTAPRMAELRGEPVAPPGPGEVRVRTLASAVSRGTEMLVYRGEAPEETELDLPTLAGSFGFPIKYGYAAVGRVIDAGDGTTELAPGDAVFVLHPHQEAFVVPETLPVRLPEGLDPLLAVFCASVETAVGIVHDAAPRLGETALVFGCGVVGQLVASLLKLAGVEVFVVEPLAVRRGLALARGADAAFVPDDDLVGRVFERTDGRGADVVVEASGSGSALATALECVAVEGSVVAASWYGVRPVTLPLGGRFHRGRVRLRSSQVGRISPDLTVRWDAARRMRSVLDLLPRLRLEDLVTHRVPFEAAPETYRRMDRDGGEYLQVVFDYE
jgi:2-desacetyl-2-hydroxyethyl bacteriochlorophyllide A dehydrogenase